MFEQLAASCLSEASLNLFENRRFEYGELARPRANWSKPATLSEIKQIKLLEASNGNELTCLIIHDIFKILQPLAAYSSSKAAISCR